jgi:ABC-2 type transport system permease protein
MNGSGFFSFGRLWAMICKEFIHVRRDRMTFGMLFGLPIVQLMLFGYAINSDPKNLPAAVLLGDDGPQARALLQAIRHSGYYKFVRQIKDEQEGREALARGDVQFVVNIPVGFTRDLLRGDKPSILVEADATDPGATGNAMSALKSFLGAALQNDLKGPLASLAGSDGPVDVQVHALYNPEAITQYNIVPGLLGVVLSMTMTMITAVALTRERDSGTMENLLTMPTRPLEVMIGKLVPYVCIGYVQTFVILGTARFLFGVPMVGDFWLILAVALVFIVANLALGITFSTIATNQRQAMQMAQFFFLPSMMLSGFMFPFRGMPEWAQTIGQVFPLTHFLRIIRGVMLKGNGWPQVAPEFWPIVAFTGGALALAVLRYRRTLD